MSCSKHRNVVQEGEPRVGDAVARPEVVQLRLSTERTYGAITGVRTGQIDALQLVTRREVRRSDVGDRRPRE
jgi:hypothetical protein